MTRRYNIISGDSHVEIAPDRWTPHVAAEWRPRAPRPITLPSGGDGWTSKTDPPTSWGWL